MNTIISFGFFDVALCKRLNYLCESFDVDEVRRNNTLAVIIQCVRVRVRCTCACTPVRACVQLCIETRNLRREPNEITKKVRCKLYVLVCVCQLSIALGRSSSSPCRLPSILTNAMNSCRSSLDSVAAYCEQMVKIITE
jgi:hypothetical protein